jgi:ecotropic viral integration site 5 protein
MKKMEKDYAELRKKEQEEMVELRVRKSLQKISPKTHSPIVTELLTFTFLLSQRLRNENRLLKKRNELLEAESTELANRLVRGQVSRAEEEETK